MGPVSLDNLEPLAVRHGFSGQLRAFKTRFLG
jgi:hypothetical protein